MGEGLKQGSREGTLSVGYSSLEDPERSATVEGWTLPLGMYMFSAPEMGASRLECDLIHHICTADLKCQLGPRAQPGDVSFVV